MFSSTVFPLIFPKTNLRAERPAEFHPPSGVWPRAPGGPASRLERPRSASCSTVQRPAEPLGWAPG